jgi:hypothetical protein
MFIKKIGMCEKNWLRETEFLKPVSGLCFGMFCHENYFFF